MHTLISAFFNPWIVFNAIQLWKNIMRICEIFLDARDRTVEMKGGGGGSTLTHIHILCWVRGSCAWMEFSFFFYPLNLYSPVPFRFATHVLEVVSEREGESYRLKIYCCWSSLLLLTLTGGFLPFSLILFLLLLPHFQCSIPLLYLRLCLSNTLHFILSFECVQCINIGLHYATIRHCMYYTMQCCVWHGVYVNM